MDRQHLRRRRVALSCIECRRRKVKCSRGDPCDRCVADKFPCTYRAYDPKPIVAQNAKHASAEVQAQLVQPQQASTVSSFIERIHDLAGPQGGASPEQQDTPPAQGTDSTLQDLARRLKSHEKAATPGRFHELSETGRDILAQQSGLQDSQIMLNKTRIMGWSHWMAIAPEVRFDDGSRAICIDMSEFATIISCLTEVSGHGDGSAFQAPETRELIAEIGNLLRKCKILAKKLKVGRPSRSLSFPDFDLSAPSRQVADVAAKLYFQSFESTHRILHAPTFWNEYERFWSRPEEVTTDQRLKVLLVIGIGSSLGDHGDLRDMVHQWIYAAQTWLTGPLEKDRLNIASMQIHCLTIIARQVFAIGGDLVWMSTGSLVNRAMQIGLHRDPKHLPTMSALQAELRRRLWATILEIVIQSSLDTAMPPRISLDEFDTAVPSNINDDEVSESTLTAQARPREFCTETSLQLLLLEAFPVRLRILQLLNGLHSELYYSDVLELSLKITDACRKNNKFVKQSGKTTIFHRNLLDYLVRRFLVPLNCPFAIKARTNPVFYYSLKVSLDTAMAIIRPEPDVGFSRLMAIGGSMFREGFRYASAIVSLELVAQTQAQCLDGTLHCNSQHREVLKQVMRDMILQSTDRMHQGETNIKSHVTLNMMMEQVEAMEAGISCEYGMAKRGRDSLVFCHGLLQARVDSMSPRALHDAQLSPISSSGGQSFMLDYGLDWGAFLLEEDAVL